MTNGWVPLQSWIKANECITKLEAELKEIQEAWKEESKHYSLSLDELTIDDVNAMRKRRAKCLGTYERLYESEG